MTDNEKITAEVTVVPARSRRRRNVVRDSPNRKEYERLMAAGWSPPALERYAAFRYGEDIPSSTFRDWRRRRKLEPKDPWAGIEPGETADVLRMGAELIQLQRERIAIDVEHERQMKKLFTGTGREIEVLRRLMTSHLEDLQSVGLMPKAGVSVDMTHRVASHVEAPRVQRLSDVIPGEVTRSTEMEAARSLHVLLGGESA